jgi:hypothetical protein
MKMPWLLVHPVKTPSISVLSRCQGTLRRVHFYYCKTYAEPEDSEEYLHAL